MTCLRSTTHRQVRREVQRKFDAPLPASIANGAKEDL